MQDCSKMNYCSKINSKLKHCIEIQEVVRIVRQAGEIAMQFYDKEYFVKHKQNKTPVTCADIAINAFLVDNLSKYNHPILSEEVDDNPEKRVKANFVWIIDPLDGTSDFIQETGDFSIMVGLVNRDGESVLGVVYAPALNELYYAEKDKGAFSCDLKFRQKIKINKKSIKNGKILVSKNHLGEFEQEIAKRYNMTQISMGSAGLKICRIARGDAELYINSSNKSGLWDVCAADIILQEAGGSICDMQKKVIKYNTKNIILDNGYIVQSMKL